MSQGVSGESGLRRHGVGRTAARVLAGFSKTSGLVLSTAIIIGLAYLLGHHMLSGELPGSDSPLHVSYAAWLDRYFPDLYHWFPLHGGGVSLLHGYPIGSHLLVVALHRLTGMSILQVFRLVSFSSFCLTAFGIFLLGWRFLGRQIVGLIAAVFFLLSPLTWTWMCNWGFFAQQVGMVFLPLVLIAFDGALSNQLAEARSGRGRLWFAALVALTLCGSLCHMLIGAAGVLGMVLITVFAALTAPLGQRSLVLHGGVKILLLLGLCLGLLAAVYIVPFISYGSVANREGLNNPPPHQLHKLPVLEFFGLRPIDPANILTRMQFPLVVSGFAMVGAIMAGVYRWRRFPQGGIALAYALSGIVATVYALTPAIAAVVLKISPMLHNFISFRTGLLVAMMLMPVVAAFGAWAIGNSILYPERLFRGAWPGADAKVKTGISISPRPTLVWLASIAIALFGIWRLPGLTTAENWLPYGPWAGVNLLDIWDKRGGYEERDLMVQLAPESWPQLVVHDDDPRMAYSKHFAAQLPEDRPLRIDISPYVGQFATDMAILADASQINSYTFQINLVHGMWGYQQNVFYSRESQANEYGNPDTLNVASQWFGGEYVLLRSEKDQPEMYQEAGWELVFEEGSIQWWRNPEAPPMATLTTRPAVLVVGKPETDAYMTVFRLASAGMLPYEQALLVEGEARIDRYSAEELEIFDALFLYGYDYKNSGKAWETLAAYVEQGGNLFIDTGWEFSVPEWEFNHAPEVLPVERLTWTNYGDTGDLTLSVPEIAGAIDVSLFKPLIWEGQPWRLSGAQASDVRDWGQMVLSAEGRPLVVAGEFGQGRVVWSGLNLIGHALYGDPNEEEIMFLGNLMHWLLERAVAVELESPEVERSNPDQVELHLRTVDGDVTWLYWREAFYPSWHAYLTDDAGVREIPIYRGGPGFMLMPIETSSGEVDVKLIWEDSVIEKATAFPSFIGIALLSTIILDGLVMKGNALTRVKTSLYERLPKPFLGKGKMHEWVKQKQAEIEDARGRRGPPVWQGMEMEPVPEQRLAGELIDVESGDREGFGLEEVSFPEIPEQSEIKALATAADHIDQREYAWAERVLRSRRQLGDMNQEDVGGREG